MPEPQVYTTNFAWRIVRKALSRLDVRDWFNEQVTFANDIDATMKVVSDKADLALTSGAVADGVTITGSGTTADPLVSVAGSGFDLQTVMDLGSTAEIATDYELEIEQDAPLSGTANPIYGRERIRNIGALSGTPKAAQMRRRAEGAGGTSYSESNQTASESNTARDFISDIAAVDVQTARVRTRVVDGVAKVILNSQETEITGLVTTGIPFDVTKTGVPAAGVIDWDEDNHRFEFGVEGGSIGIGEVEDFYSDLDPGGALVEGEIVSIIGVSGNRSAVARTDASDSQSVSACIGMVTHVDGLVRVAKNSRVRGLNTLGMTEGAPVYLDATTPGAWTQTPPAKGAAFVHVGIVEVASATVGVIMVEVRVVASLEQLANVEAPTGFGGEGATYRDDGAYPVYDFAAGKFTMRNAIAGPQVTGFNPLYGATIIEATWTPPNGEPEHLDVVISGNVEACILGKPLDWEAAGCTVDAGTVAFPSLTTTGLTNTRRFLRVNYTTGLAEWTTDIWSFSDVQIAVAVFDAAGYAFTLNECHTSEMPASVHEEMHARIGTYTKSGGTLDGYVALNENAVNRRPNVADQVIRDEDLSTTIENIEGIGSDYCRVKLTSSGILDFVTDSQEIIELSGGNPLYNTFSGTWGTTVMSVNRFAPLFVFAVPVTSDTTSQKYRQMWMMPQSQHATQAEAEAVMPNQLNMGNLSSLATEFVFHKRVVLKRSGTGWSIASNQVLTGSSMSQISAGTVAGYLTTVLTDGLTAQGAGISGSPIARKLPDAITTSADGTTTLTVNSVRSQLVTGSGSNHVISLPDATTLLLGDRFEILNASSEFIIVKNSGTASSAWIQLMPGATMTATCSSIGSAAGTWVIAVDEPKDALIYDNDFLAAYGANNTPIDIRCVIGTGAGYYVTGEAYTSSKGGELVQDLGADPAGYVNSFYLGQALTGTTVLNKGKPFLFRQLSSASALSDGTNTYSLAIGLYDKSNGDAITNCVAFITDADGDLIPTCMLSSTPTTIAAGAGKVGINGTYSDLMWICNSAATRVDFWSDKTYIGKIETNIPKAVALFAGTQFDRSAGGTGRTNVIDRLIGKQPR